MREFLSDYQKAALQVMGISAWSLKNVVEPVNRASEDWVNEHKMFVSDVQVAIDYLHSNSDGQGRSEHNWRFAEREELAISDNTIYIPQGFASLTSAQKKLLWSTIQQSFMHGF